MSNSDIAKMRRGSILLGIILTLSSVLVGVGAASMDEAATAPPFSSHLKVKAASVQYHSDLNLLIFEISTEGTAGAMIPNARGQLDEAPVLAYVFVTDLKPDAAGFGIVDGGILALAVTVHPDFDDTPLWDENSDGRYDNDGMVYHPHWVVLVPDKRVGGGLSVAQFNEGDASVILPPTNPGMPIYLDSPGFQVNLIQNKVQVMVPAYRLKGNDHFKFDAVTAYLQVNTSNEAKPMLGVYKVYDILSGDLSLPYKVETK